MYYRSKYILKGRISSIHYSLVYKSFRSKHPILSLGMCPENLVPGQFPISLFRSTKRFTLNKMFKQKAALKYFMYQKTHSVFHFVQLTHTYETNARKSNKLHEFSYTQNIANFKAF